MLLLEKRSITAIVAGYNDDKDYAYVIRDISFEIRNVYSLHSWSITQSLLRVLDSLWAYLEALQ